MKRTALLCLIVISLLTQTGCDVAQIGQMLVQGAGMLQQMQGQQRAQQPAAAARPQVPQAAPQNPATNAVARVPQTNPANPAVRQENINNTLKPGPENTEMGTAFQR